MNSKSRRKQLGSSPNKNQFSITINDNQQFNDLFNIKQECEIQINDFAKMSNLEANIFEEFSFDKIKCEPELEIIDELPAFHKPKSSKKLKVSEVYANFQRIESSEWQKRIVQKVQKFDQIFPCEFCSKSLPSSHGLIRHVSRCHKDIIKKAENLICDLCGKSMVHKQQLFVHMRSHKPLVTCSICNKTMKPICLKTHMKQVHGDQPKFKCTLCSKISASEMKFKQHLKTHVKKYECDICNRIFSENYRYKQHMLWHKDSTAFACKMCNKEFNRQGSLNEHMKVHNKDAAKAFKCDLCDFSTLYAKRLKYHKSVHVKIAKRQEKLKKLSTSVKCEICNVLLVHKYALKDHIRIVHTKKLYSCDFCGVKTASKGSISKHMKRFHISK